MTPRYKFWMRVSCVLVLAINVTAVGLNLHSAHGAALAGHVWQAVANAMCIAVNAVCMQGVWDALRSVWR
jgi:hypothetical protein